MENNTILVIDDDRNILAIIELYLNFIYLGQGCRGVRSAAATYYGKEVESLTAAECASIIGITNSPTWYDPYQNPENNEERKENILWVMNKYGWLTDAEYEEALNQELVLEVVYYFLQI